MALNRGCPRHFVLQLQESFTALGAIGIVMASASGIEGPAALKMGKAFGDAGVAIRQLAGIPVEHCWRSYYTATHTEQYLLDYVTEVHSSGQRGGKVRTFEDWTAINNLKTSLFTQEVQNAASEAYYVAENARRNIAKVNQSINTSTDNNLGGVSMKLHNADDPSSITYDSSLVLYPTYIDG